MGVRGCQGGARETPRKTACNREVNGWACTIIIKGKGEVREEKEKGKEGMDKREDMRKRK